jgi:hypothetical protein
MQKSSNTHSIINTPWDDNTIKVLNKYQQSGWVHPYTCGDENCRDVLIATKDGWTCPSCDYTQSWAHGFHTRRLNNELA